MKNYVQKGDVLPFTAAADYASGAPVIIGSICGVTQDAVSNGQQGEALVEHVVRVPKDSSSFAAGAVVNFAGAAGSEQATSGAGTQAGYAVHAAATGDTHVVLKLSS